MAGKRKRTIYIIYLPPTDQVTEEDMRVILEQLPAPMILLGNFNAQPTMGKNQHKRESTGEKPR